MIALGYVRRSKATSDDAREGRRVASLEVQAAKIREYAMAQGWTLAEIITDDGISGGKRERLDRIAARVKATHAQRIVVYNLDRFARDVAGLLDSLRTFQRRGVELHVVGRGKIEAATASGFLVTTVEGMVAEHFRRVISEKTRDALAKLRAEGRRTSGIAPYGFTFGPDARLVAVEDEQHGLRLIAALSGNGLSLRQLSRTLAERGVLARSEQPFRACTLSKLLRVATPAPLAIAGGQE
jgi:DNA invertase Pin-like site-specific DNA recombinase